MSLIIVCVITSVTSVCDNNCVVINRYFDN